MRWLGMLFVEVRERAGGIRAASLFRSERALDYVRRVLCLLLN